MNKKMKDIPLNRQTKAQLLNRVDQLSQALKRERADALNAQQRFKKDQTKVRLQAQIDIVTNLLPLIDNLERAFKAVPANIKEDNWVKGVVQIRQQLASQLQDLKIEPIEVVGKNFDPEYMEALATVEDKSKPPQTVIEEIVKGYLYDDQILRIAQVKVST